MDKRTILIVDDEPININLIAEILSDKNDIRVATNGEEAIKIAKSNRLDLILLDIVMPIMDGFEVAKNLKSNEDTKDIPIIFITGNNDEKNIEKAYLSGGSDYITKPLKAKELLARVGREIKLNSLIKNLEERVKEEVKNNMKKEQILIQQTKMAEMGSMIGAIAHQWKQPLNTLSLICKNMSMKYDRGLLDRDELSRIEDKAKSQITFMSETIDDFRNFFKPSKYKKSFLVNDVLSEVMKLLNAKIKEFFISVAIDENGSFSIFGYENELKQVILNIINNSIDVIKEKRIENGKIDIFIEKKSNFGIILFRDNGGGVVDELLPDKLFEPYISTKGEDGTGIGLQISKTIIENNMGGRISVKNIENGAEFKIELPINN